MPDEILFGLDPRAAVFGIRLGPSSEDGDPPRGRVSLSMLCRLVSALDCPSCLTLGEAPCGAGWGIGIEGVPDGVRVTLLEGGHRVGELAAGPPRGDGEPFASRAGRRSLEITFAPRGPNEHVLVFEGDPVIGRAGAGVIFPIRLTIFRDDAAEG